ncbi:unnamed protein product [Blepharisma stoltei]|uniref:LNR domain-containing protein n=1 Tax=Blepharisma stoltei TaxID=1481888 RepID=A0AAU9J7G6_9CILI|nr:unnamed protein product [Blepharisma stoltei]
MFLILIPLVSASCSLDCLMLAGDGYCDSQCDTLDCNFDSLDCPIQCSPGCSPNMIGNGICNKECYTSSCTFDNIDCINLCSGGCLPSMIGDKQCQNDCFNENCLFDAGDCFGLCSQNCSFSMLGDGVCQPQCANEKCNFDNDDCTDEIWVDQRSLSGDGSKEKPFSSLDYAFLYSSIVPHLRIIMASGIYYLNSSLSASNSQYLTLTGENLVQIRPISPLASITFSNYSKVWIENLTYDGSEFWIPNCSNDYCMFAQNWVCNQSSCHNSNNDSLPSSIDIPKTFSNNQFCYSYAPSLSFFNSEVYVSNFVVQNIDRVFSIFVLSNCISHFDSLLVKHVRLLSYLIDVKSSSPLIFYAPFKNSYQEFNVPLNINKTYSLVEMRNSRIEDVNRMIDYGTVQCSSDFVSPGILQVSNVDTIYISNLTVDNVWNNDEITDKNPQPFISISQFSKAEINDVNVTSTFFKSGGFLYLYFSTILGIDINRENIIIKNINVNDSFIGSDGALIAVSYREIQPIVLISSITINQVSTYGCPLISISFDQDTFCGSDDGNILALDVLLPFYKRNIQMNNVKIENSDTKASALKFQNVSNVFLYNVTINNCPNKLNNLFESISSFQSLTSVLPYWASKSSSSNIISFQNTRSITLNQIKIDNYDIGTSPVIQLLDIIASLNLTDIFSSNGLASSFLIFHSNFNPHKTFSSIQIESSAFSDGAIIIDSNVSVALQSIILSKVSANSGISSSNSGLIVTDSLFSSLSTINSAVLFNPKIPGSSLTILLTTFTSNKAQNSADLYVQGDQGIVLTVDSAIFEHSQGQASSSVLFSPTTTLISGSFNNCIFQHMAPFHYLGVFANTFLLGSIKFVNTLFHNIQSIGSAAPVIYAEVSLSENELGQVISFENCNVTYSSFQYFYIYESQYMRNQLTIEKSSFYGNTGSMFSFENTDASITNSQFFNNSAINQEFWTAYGSRIEMNAVRFYQNYADEWSSLLSLNERSVLTASNVAFSQNNFQATNIIIMDKSSLTLSNWSFIQNSCDVCFQIYQSSSQFSGGQSAGNVANAIIFAEKSDAKLINVSFSSEYKLLSISESTLSINNTTGSNISGTAIQMSAMAAQFTNLTLSNVFQAFSISNSNFQANQLLIEENKSPFEIGNSQITISNSTISKSLNGLIVHSSNITFSRILVSKSNTPLQLDSSNVFVYDSSFLSNTNTALVSFNSSLIIISSILQENQGSIGGGLYISDSREARIESSSFLNNQAYHGGAIYHDLTPVSILSCEFYDNSAKYGRNFASFPKRIVLESADLINITSGSTIPNITFVFLDIYNQTASTDSLSSVSIQALSNETVIGGTSKVYGKDGKFEFEELRFYHMPGENATFVISADSSQIESLEFSISFRNCLIGEIHLPDNSCNLCENNTYSINRHDKFCKSCPPDAVCLGGKNVFPNAGYWRSGEFSENFYSCPNSEACIGNKTDYTGGCAEGYKGTLCAICEKQYFKSNSYICSKCPSKFVSFFLFALALLVVVTIIVGLVASNIKSSLKDKSDFGLLLKMMMSYIQTIMLFSSYYMKWPNILRFFFAFSNMAGNAPAQMSSLECSDSSIIPSIQTTLQEVIQINSLPLVFMLLCVGFWAVFSWVKKEYSYMNAHLICTIMVVLFVFNSSLTNSLFSLFGCRNIDGEYLMADDYSVQCWVGDHWLIIAIVGLPGIGIWCLGFPLVMFYILYKNRHSLDSPDIQLKYRSFYGGYKSRFYYWELLIICRRMLIRGIAVILINYPLTVQGLAVILVLGTIAFLQLGFKPYEKPIMNSMEFASILLALLYMIAGLLISAGIGEIPGQIIAWLVFIGNCVFFIYWSLLTYRALAHASKNISILKFISSKMTSFKKKFSSKVSHFTNESNVSVSRFTSSSEFQSSMRNDNIEFPKNFKEPIVSFEDEEGFEEPSVNPWINDNNE